MFSIFKKDPVKKLKKLRIKKLEEAVKVQRSGDLKLYASIMKEISEIEEKIESLSSNG